MHFWSLVSIIVNCGDLEFKDMYSYSDNFCDYTFSICSVNVLILSSACTTLTVDSYSLTFLVNYYHGEKETLVQILKSPYNLLGKSLLSMFSPSKSHVSDL